MSHSCPRIITSLVTSWLCHYNKFTLLYSLTAFFLWCYQFLTLLSIIRKFSLSTKLRLQKSYTDNSNGVCSFVLNVLYINPCSRINVCLDTCPILWCAHQYCVMYYFVFNIFLIFWMCVKCMKKNYLKWLVRTHCGWDVVMFETSFNLLCNVCDLEYLLFLNVMYTVPSWNRCKFFDINCTVTLTPHTRACIIRHNLLTLHGY